MYDGLKNLEVPKRSRGKHPGARRVFKIGLVGVLVLMVAVGGTGVWLYNYINNKLDQARDPLIKVDRALPGEPINVLVLGNDRRDVVPEKERNQRQFKGSGGNLTDTILLIHISPKAERAVVVSFPRDLRVDIPGCGMAKINSAYSCSGKSPNRTIQTIKQLTGLEINHYVEINFLGFREIVDSIGGVTLCVKKAYDDPKSGLKIPSPGCHELDGDMALSWVRARAIDPRADIGRVERQQQFIRLLMKEVKDVGFLLNVPKVTRFVNALSKGVKLSKDVDVWLGRKIADQLSRNERSVDFRIIPANSQYIGGISYLVPDDTAEKLFRALRDDTELPNVGKTAASLPRRKDISIKILNGAGVPGLAAQEKERLEKLGFDVISIGDAPSRYERTTIVFEPGDELMAKLVEEEYPEADVRAVTRDLPADIVLTLGEDIAAARASPSPGPS